MENGEESYIVMFPAFEVLRKELDRLRTELSMLVLERDELLCIECKNIEMQYMLELGALEYKAYQAQCSALRARRKLELVRARRNRQEAVSLQQIELLLDEEFAEYQKKLEEQLHRMNEAICRSQSEVLTESETQELKKLYRRIVKALHPDLHPEFGEEQKELFYSASRAYENGDLALLRVIGEMVSDAPEVETGADAMEELVREKTRLMALMEAVRETIRSIRSSYPYTMKDLLADPEKVKQRKRELQEILAQYQAQAEHYLAELQELLR